MNSEPEEEALKPQEAALPPGQGELPEKPSMGKGGEDPHQPASPLPQGPFRPITDPGEETGVEENDNGPDRPKH